MGINSSNETKPIQKQKEEEIASKETQKTESK